MIKWKVYLKYPYNKSWQTPNRIKIAVKVLQKTKT